MQRRKPFYRPSFALALMLVAPRFCAAQTTGYIAGTSSLTSFSTTTGNLENSFATGGTGLPFAVAGDDSTLFMTTDPEGNGGALRVVSGPTGQTLNSLSLGLSATKVLLSSDGATPSLAGVSFPSGELISITPVAFDAQTIALPQ